MNIELNSKDMNVNAMDIAALLLGRYKKLANQETGIHKGFNTVEPYS